MKTIQNFLLGALLVFISSVGFYACKKTTDDEMTLKPIELITKDTRFLKIINDNILNISNVKDVDKAKVLLKK